MTCITDFRKSISEVEQLIKYAKRNSNDIARYQLFDKAAIIFLSIKFEVFLEDFVEEHSRLIVNHQTNKAISVDIRQQYIEMAISKAVTIKKVGEKERYLRQLSCLWQDNERDIKPLMDVRPSTKFNYGKHGQSEIETLFNNHGLSVFIHQPEVQTILRSLNSLICVRNNVIHQDASPSLTHQDVYGYLQNILRFVDLLESDIHINSMVYYHVDSQ